jgi:hypothetical protein
MIDDHMQWRLSTARRDRKGLRDRVKDQRRIGNRRQRHIRNAVTALGNATNCCFHGQ